MGRVTTRVVQELVNEMQSRGIGRATIIKAMVILSSMFKKGVAWGMATSNPVRDVDRPRSNGSRRGQALSPLDVERLRVHLLDAGRLRDATMIACLAYLGTRPSELLALTWGDVDLAAGRVVIDKSLDLDGETKGTETGRGRVVAIVPPLRGDLVAWREACGEPDGGLDFPRPSDGRPWSECDYRNWRVRVFHGACRKVGLGKLRPYDLRHSYVSLMLTGGVNPQQVAHEAGHNPMTMWSVYAHLIPGTNGNVSSPEEMIREARLKAGDRQAACAPKVNFDASESPAEAPKVFA